MFSSFQSWTFFHLNNTPQKGLRNSFLGSFFMFSAPRPSPARPPFSLLRGHRNSVNFSEKTPKDRVFQSKFSHSPLPSSCFALPMPSPWKSHTKSARAAGNPGFFKQIAPIFEKLLGADSKLDVCPRKGRNEGGAWGEKEGKITRTTCAFLAERRHSSSF